MFERARDGGGNTEKISFSFEDEPFLSKCFTFGRRAGGGRMELKNNPFFFTFIWVYTDCLKQKRVVGESLTNTHTNHGVSRKNATFFSVSSFNRQSFCTSFSVVAHGTRSSKLFYDSRKEKAAL